jgi:hypothetical protein
MLTLCQHHFVPRGYYLGFEEQLESTVRSLYTSQRTAYTSATTTQEARSFEDKAVSLSLLILFYIQCTREMNELVKKLRHANSVLEKYYGDVPEIVEEWLKEALAVLIGPYIVKPVKIAVILFGVNRYEVFVR